MQSAIRVGICLAFAVAGAGWAGPEPRTNGRLRDLKYGDQFGVQHALSFPGDRPRVLVLADREGSAQIASWVEPLVERYGAHVEIRGVALLGGVPALLRPTLRSLFRRRLSYPILMDWENAAAAAFDYCAGAALVVALDPAGAEVWRSSGAANADRLAEIFRRLDALTPNDAPAGRRRIEPSASP